MFTLGNWIFFVILVFVAIFTCVFVFNESYSKAGLHTLIAALICIIVIGGTMAGIAWYNTSTASGIRALKDNQSNLKKGIEREIVITSEDGREIFRYDGKIDIESNHEDNYIKFDDENGKRYIIYYGVQDTITIIEK